MQERKSQVYLKKIHLLIQKLFSIFICKVSFLKLVFRFPRVLDQITQGYELNKSQS